MKRSLHFFRKHYVMLNCLAFLGIGWSGHTTSLIEDFVMTLTPTPETCIGNGEITIDITNTEAGAEFEFQVYELPDTTTPVRVVNGVIATGTTLQNTITGFPNGNYRVIAVQVVGIESNQESGDTTINDNKENVSFTISQSDNCNDADLTVNVTAGNPSTYELLDTGGNVVVPAQGSNVFMGIPAGDYTVVVTDVCGDVNSLGYTVTSVVPSTSFTRPGTGGGSVSGFFVLADCNNIRHTEQLLYDGSATIPNIYFPMTVEYTITNPTGGPDTTISTTWNSNADNNEEVLIPFYDGESYTYEVTITDNCGYVSTTTDTINAGFDFTLRNFFAANTCGGARLEIRSLRYFQRPLEVTFTQYPASFDPADYNSGFAPGAYTAIDPPSGFGGDGNAVPPGTYEMSITDACGRTAVKQRTLGPPSGNPSYPLRVSEAYGGCDADEGMISIYMTSAFIQTANITSMLITAAPAAYTDPLPSDVSANITAEGYFNMNSLPIGEYSFEAESDCGTTETATFNVSPAVVNSDLNLDFNCGSTNISYELTAQMRNEKVYLQKFFPASNSWGHPTTGVLYAEGTPLDNSNGIFLFEDTGDSSGAFNTDPLVETTSGTLNNFVETGTFRILVNSAIYENGTFNLEQCYTTTETFLIEDNRINVNDFIVSNCVIGGQTELIIDAVGAEPLNYSIIAVDGVTLPTPIDNGTDPAFTQIPAGDYMVRIDDVCGNNRVLEFSTNDVRDPIIRPDNLCDGQEGSLFVPGFTFLDIEWTKDGDPTVLGTGNTLTFSSFNEATDTGLYSATLSYNPNPNACVNRTVTFEVVAPQPAPNAGTGQTVTINQADAGTINLFDFVTPPFDNFGEWTDLTNGSVLNSDFYDATGLPVGTYEFEYTVNGQCSGTDSTVVTLNIVASDLTANDDTANACADSTDVLNIMDNDTEFGNPVNQANYAVSTETADPNGILTVNPDGSVDVAVGAVAGQTYTLEYRITDNNTASNFATAFVNITINETPDEPILVVSNADCTMDGSATILNYDPAVTYEFTPAGPTVGGTGLINDVAFGTTYDVIAIQNSCSSATASFTNFEQITSANSLDTDGDSVPDFCDLDDDNDGILDTDECPDLNRQLLSNGDFESGTNFQVPDLWTNRTTDPNSPFTFKFEFTPVGATTPTSVMAIAGASPGGATNPDNVVVRNNALLNLVNGVSYSLSFATGFDSPNTEALNYQFILYDANSPTGAPSLLIGNEYTIGGNNASGIQVPNISTDPLLSVQSDFDFTLPSGSYYLGIRILGVDGQSGRDIYIDDVSLSSNECLIDTDNDGIANGLDTDSDNDGCPDATEGADGLAANETLTGGSNGGSSNNLGTTVDADGIPTVANGGQAITAAVTNGEIVTINDVTSNPVQPVCEGTDVTFTVDASFTTITDYGAQGSDTTDDTLSAPATAGLIYNWFENSDPNTSLSTASTLDLTGVTVAMDGNVYIVQVTSPNNSCVEERTISLTISNNLAQVGTEIATCDAGGTFYTLEVELDGTAPFTATGTGAPGSFDGNIWTSDNIATGTDYDVDFTDTNTCSTLNVVGTAPVCCVFEVTCPTFPETTLSCYDDIPTKVSYTKAEFEALGNADGFIEDSLCGILEISATNSMDTGSCSQTVTRTYTVTEYEDTNSNGIRDTGEDTVLNTSDCVQAITVADTTPPVFNGELPMDGNVDCEAVPEAVELTATDACGETTVTFDETRTEGSCSSRYTLIRTWTAEDACGNATSHTQALEVACGLEVFNAVSADGDGTNEVFRIEGIDCYPDNTVMIFNRWGVKVFEVDGYDNGRNAFRGLSDGRATVARGERLPTGNYFYILQYRVTGDGDPVQRSGYLYLASANQ